MKPALMLIGIALMTACSPTEVADKVGRRAAESVVLPVVARALPGPQAEVATRCIVDNASAADVQLLARDVGVEAGTSTVMTVQRLASNPATLSCLAQAGISRLAV